MGGEGSHPHVHIIDDEEVTVYMPFPSHDAYMEAKEKMKDMMDEDKEMMEDEEKMAITPRDVHTEKPIGSYAQSDCDCDENKEV